MSERSTHDRPGGQTAVEPPATGPSHGRGPHRGRLGATAAPNGKEAFFARLGRRCYRRRWTVIGVWFLIAVIGGATLGAVGTDLHTDFTLPDVESKRGADILDEDFGGEAGGWTGSIVFVADQGVGDPEVAGAMDEFFTAVASVDNVIHVTSPYGPRGQDQVATEGDLAGRLAYADVGLSANASIDVAADVKDDVVDLLPDIDGVEIELGGIMFADWEEEPTSEIIGVAFAIVILIVAFGSVLAMGLPISLALAGIGVGTILAGFVSHAFEVPEFAVMLGVMIGLGVGIDYALFIVTRFRENRRAGHDIEDSITIAINTAGRAVAFAGATVVTSLLGLLVMQLGFVTGLAITAAVIVGVTMIASLTLLPALIGLVGHRVEVTRRRGVIAAGLVSVALLGVAFEFEPLMLGMPLAIVVLLVGLAWAPLKRELRPRKQRPIERTAAYRWSRVIQHRPWPAALGGAGLLILLALPVFGMRLGWSDEGNFPTDTTTRKAYDLLADGFGPGYNGPILMVSEIPGGTDPSTLATDTAAITAALRGHDGIAAVGDANCNNPGSADAALVPCGESPASTAVMWYVVPETSPQDQRTTELVKSLRSDTLPPVTDGTSLDVALTGNVAGGVDFSDYMADRMPFFFAAVLGLSFLLLMVVFRSILVPLKAVVMNLLGIGAAYGVIVAGFQWGWLGGLLGFDSGPIEPFIPMMLFAIVFGLSMDYEVFLLSRIKEDWDRTRDSHTSVANGLATTARVITAAALIMIAVFGAFSLNDDRAITIWAVGLAAAVFLDATVVRMLLVPATMELLGDRNWWLPKWLDRILPTIDVEGHAATEAASSSTPSGDGDGSGGGDSSGEERGRELEPA